jgi:hypothetical protein
MGSHQIVDKLRLEFKQPIVAESQVVYILVEIGKLLEHGNKKKDFPTINFYRNWAVHTRLDRSDFADALVRNFDDFIADSSVVMLDCFQKLLKPESLRSELRSFCEYFQLEFPPCSDGLLWKNFVKYLARVLDETPLQCYPQNSKKLRYVRSVTVFRSRNQNGTAMLTWRAQCNPAPPDAAMTTINVVLLPDIESVEFPEPLASTAISGEQQSSIHAESK